MSDDLISRKALKDALREKEWSIYPPIDDIDDVIDMQPAVDAIQREEYEDLVKRIKHLLNSELTRSFDEVCIATGKYKRDIAEADKVQRHGKWSYDDRYYIGGACCSLCGGAAHGKSKYCPNCGARMDKEVQGNG